MPTSPQVLTVPAAGSSTTFTAPQNLGTFVLRAIAVTPDLTFGTAEASLIVRRDVSITAALPRFARVGDIFSAGVLVTQQGGCGPAKCPAVHVSVAVTGDAVALTSDAPSTQKVNLEDGQTTEVRFSFEAAALGSV